VTNTHIPKSSSTSSKTTIGAILSHPLKPKQSNTYQLIFRFLHKLEKLNDDEIGADDEDKKEITLQLGKIEKENKLSALLDYGKNSKGLEDKNFDGAHRKAKRKGIKVRGKSRMTKSRFKSRSRKRFNRDKKRDPFAMGMNQFRKRNDLPAKKSDAKVMPSNGVDSSGKEHNNSEMALNGNN